VRGGISAFRQFVKKKKVTSKRQGYLSFMDYFATGEGRTTEFNFCYADSKEEAKDNHLDKFVGERKEARDYFGSGIKVVTVKSTEAKTLLDTFFKNGELLQENLIKAGIEFHMKFYVNYS
jgi:hypothetical protein